MHVKELADITGVNIETIRSYRKAGYLNPIQRSNGYYDYDMESLITLLWIRKLRGYTMSMDQIHQYFYSADSEELLEILSDRRKYILDEIAARELSVRFIDLETRHIKETMSNNLSGAEMMQSIDDKIDIYFLQNRSEWFQQLQFSMTPTLRIPQKILNGPITDETIPVQIGLGTYQYILDEHDFKRPDDAVIVPNGLNITQVIILNDFRELSIRDLEPMMTYAKVNKLRFLSDTTGYLMRIEMKHNKTYFHFRIRSCVQKNAIKDPVVLAHSRR